MPVTLAPDDIVRTHADAAANEREPLLVLEPLIEFLDAHGLEAPADLTASPIGDGHSNVTFALSTGSVLRRPPRGPLAAERPRRAPRGPAARSARFDARARAEGARGVRGHGRDRRAVLRDGADRRRASSPTRFPTTLDTPEQHGRIADELIDALVELHGTDWEDAGLEGFGKPTGYLERQLRRFNGLWEHNRTRELPQVEEVGAWLQSSIPDSPPATIVHGDYRLGNTMFAAAAPARLIAIFDWEMATIGDPLADVGYMLMHWTEPGDNARQVQPEQRDAPPRVPHARRADQPLRRAVRSIGEVPRLVRDARAVEGRRVHGGQLQAGARGLDRRSVPEDVRRRRRRDRRPRAGGDASMASENGLSAGS